MRRQSTIGPKARMTADEFLVFVDNLGGNVTVEEGHIRLTVPPSIAPHYLRAQLAPIYWHVLHRLTMAQSAAG